jgi:hypothetical protein
VPRAGQSTDQMKVEATLPLLQFLRTAEAASRGVVLSVAARDLRGVKRLAPQD